MKEANWKKQSERNREKKAVKGTGWCRLMAVAVLRYTRCKAAAIRSTGSNARSRTDFSLHTTHNLSGKIQGEFDRPNMLNMFNNGKLRSWVIWIILYSVDGQRLWISSDVVAISLTLYICSRVLLIGQLDAIAMKKFCCSPCLRSQEIDLTP